MTAELLHEAQTYDVVDVETLQPHPDNPRRGDDAALVEILRQLDGDLDGTLFEQDEVDALLAEADVLYATSGDDDLQPSEPVPFAVFDRQCIADAALEHFRRSGFPFPTMPLHQQMHEINQLASLSDPVLLTTRVAYQVADCYHPHRFNVPIPGKRTPLSTFLDDKRLRIAFDLLLDHGQALSSGSVRAMCHMVRGAQGAANFRPGFALLMYRRFCPPGSIVLDTSAGFGGRLVGYAASQCGGYIGIDPHPTTQEANAEITRTLGVDGVELLCQPAEDVDPATLRERCGFAFTSPPYFAKEHYSDDETQSWVRYRTGDAWRSGFLQPMLALQHSSLVDGAYSVINIADIDIGQQHYPLVDWTIDDAQAAGFTLERMERFPISRVPGRGELKQKYEPLLIFRKGADDA
jgi:hypothetical protein